MLTSKGETVIQGNKVRRSSDGIKSEHVGAVKRFREGKLKMDKDIIVGITVLTY